MRLEVTRFKSDVLNLYRSHVESLSRLPEFQKDEKADADKKAADEPAEPAAEEPVEDQAAVQQPEAEAPAQEPDTAGKETDSAADAEDDKAVESSEDFWEKMKASSSWILLRMQSRTDRTMMPSRHRSSASKARVHKQI